MSHAHQRAIDGKDERECAQWQPPPPQRQQHKPHQHGGLHQHARRPQDFSSSESAACASRGWTNGWANSVKKVKIEKTASNESSAGSNVPQPWLTTASARSQAARSGLLKIRMPLKASSRWLGLSSGSMPTSKPKRACQIRSPSPLARNSGTPSTASSYPGGTAGPQV